MDLSQIIAIFNKLNDQTRYAVLGAVVILVILIDVFVLVMPQMAGIAGINDQVKKLSDDTQEVLTDRQRIGLLKKNIEKARVDYGTMNARIRPIQEVPVILSTISSIANEFGVAIDQLVPEKSQQEAIKTGLDGKYYALPIVIKARCGYHKFGHFLNKLENEQMFFILNDFIVENDDKDTSTHAYSMTIKLILVDRTASSGKNP